MITIHAEIVARVKVKEDIVLILLLYKTSHRPYKATIPSLQCHHTGEPTYISATPTCKLLSCTKKKCEYYINKTELQKENHNEKGRWKGKKGEREKKKRNPNPLYGIRYLKE